MADLNQCKLSYYQANGATANQVDDAEYEFLQGVTATDGSVNDMWFEYLRSILLTGTLNDMRDSFWITNGCGQ